MPDPLRPFMCRSCRARGRPSDVVLDLGSTPAADYFPLATDPLPDPGYPLSMWCCPECGLAQLTDDQTNADEPRAVEPAALREQAADAVVSVAGSGVLGPAQGSTVAEFTSPHGGSWLSELTGQGLVPAAQSGRADVVVDSFGLMHEPDQRGGIQQRADRLAPGGVLLLQFHSLEAILARREWNALRHGHFAYYSLTSLLRLLESVHLVPLDAWEFALYGKTILLAATHAGTAQPASEAVARILRREAELLVTRPDSLRHLQQSADLDADRLRDSLAAATRAGRRVYGYGAASRAVAVLSRAGLTAEHLHAVADASPAKQGRLMPGTRIPVISPAELLLRRPDDVLLLLPDLLPEVSQALPELAGRWRTGVDLAETERTPAARPSPPTLPQTPI